ncbi:MAG: FHA domain-containing protein [Myxococcota bacterium]
MIGRAPNADFQLRDPHISVAHAGIDLRKGQLCLLPYRGPVWFGGKRVSDALNLQKGLMCELGAGLWIRVTDLECPPRVPTLQVDDAPPVLLGEPMWHLANGGLLRRGLQADRIHIWEAHNTWYLREPGRPARELEEEDWIEVGEHEVWLEFRTLEEAGAEGTKFGGDVPPLVIRSEEELTTIEVDGWTPIHLVGLSHRVIRELGRLTVVEQVGPKHWRDLAMKLWLPTQNHERRWDRTKNGVRRRLLAYNLPPDLYQTDQGIVQLHLRECDRFELLDPSL